MNYLLWLKGIASYLLAERQITEERQENLLVAMLTISILVYTIFSIVNYFSGFYVLSAFEVLLVVVNYICLIVSNNTIPIAVKERITVFVTTLLMFMLFAFGGIEDTGIYWLLILPFIIFSMIGIKKGWWWLLFFVTGISALQLSDHLSLLHIPYSIAQTLQFLSAFVVFTALALIFEVNRLQHFDELESNNHDLQQARSKLSDSLNNMEEQVKIRTFELRESNDLLKKEVELHKQTNEMLRVSEQKFYQAQKMESLGTLVNGLAYDYKNVLSGIDENLFVIQRSIKGNAIVQDRLDKVEKLVQHASDTAKQLQIFARQGEQDKENFDLRELMKQVFKLASLSLPSDIRLEKRISDKAMPVSGSPTQIQQVIINLFNNASDALGEQKNPTITLNAMHLEDAGMLRNPHPSLSGEWLYLSVGDNGRGIDPMDIPHIFDPFFSTKDLGKGMGLGLAMCYGVIQSHGGVIEVESEPDVGTTFHMYLPLARNTTAGNMY